MKSRSFWPEKLFIAADAEQDSMTQRVLERLQKHHRAENRELEVIRLDESGDPITELGYFDSDNASSDAEKFSLGKKSLLLTRHKGEWLKSCPGTSNHVCCNLWVINPGEGCPMDCTYCYLQTYLRRNPTLKLYTNTDDMLEAIRAKALANPSRLFRVGTGELIDSLVWDDLNDLSCELVPFFAGFENLVLELKSKHDFVDNLVSMKDVHRERTVVSWSVNARRITGRDEAFTSSLEQRVEAACKVIEAGYRVGFHFDPVVHFQGWEDEYRDAVRDIFSRVDPKRVAWVSVATLRFRREMQSIMAARFPESELPYAEQIVAKDNKTRYVQPLRLKLVNFVWNELKAVSQSLPVYMCMESSTAWRTVSGGPPVAGAELAEVFSKRGKLPIVSSSYV